MTQRFGVDMVERPDGSFVTASQDEEDISGMIYEALGLLQEFEWDTNFHQKRPLTHEEFRPRVEFARDILWHVLDVHRVRTRNRRSRFDQIKSGFPADGHQAEFLDLCGAMGRHLPEVAR